MKAFSRIISTVLHPLIIPIIGLFIIFHEGGHYTFIPIDQKRLVYVIVFLSTCLLPLSLIPLFLQLGVIKSIYMKERRERLLPIAFTGLFYMLGYYFLARFPIVPFFIKGFMLATLLTILAAMLITFFWKISMHMIGVGGLTAAVLAMAFRFGIDAWVLFSFVVLITGLLGTARLYLNAHTPAQVHTGFVLGFLVVFSGILI